MQGTSADLSCDVGSSDLFVKQKKDQKLKGREENLLKGRIVRKKTMPSVPLTKKRTSQDDIPVQEKLYRMDRATHVEIQPSSPLHTVN